MALQLVTPSLEHLPGFLQALAQGWSPDTTRGADYARELHAKVQADPGLVIAVGDDPEGRGPVWQGSDGRWHARLPGRVRWLWTDTPGHGGEPAGFAGAINLRWARDAQGRGIPELPPLVSGHIGYAVVPWQRRRGLAAQALGLMLPLAWAEGLPWVHITTDPDNLASQRVMLANGAVFVERFERPTLSGPLPGLRYRIDRPAAG